MHINDLYNLVILSRKGIETLSETISPDEAEAAWRAIKNAQELINKYKEENKEREENANKNKLDDMNVEVVSFNDGEDNGESELGNISKYNGFRYQFKSPMVAQKSSS